MAKLRKLTKVERKVIKQTRRSREEVLNTLKAHGFDGLVTDNSRAKREVSSACGDLPSWLDSPITSIYGFKKVVDGAVKVALRQGDVAWVVTANPAGLLKRAWVASIDRLDVEEFGDYKIPE